MANVLGELFQNIANAIRGKTGSTEKLSPSEFASAISSIVIGSGSTGGGTSGTGTLKIASGTFKINDITDNKRKTIAHGLGEMPDLVLVYATAYGLFDYDGDGNTESGIDSDDALTLFTGAPLLAAWGMKKKFESSFITSYKALIGDASVAFSSTSSTAGIDTTNSDFLIRCRDDSTFEVGGTGTSHLFAMGNYAWVAIAGMGGTSADVRYVTFKNGSQTLYKKAVAYGDDCVNVLSKGLISTPTKASTAQYHYTYYGWGSSDGGAADSSILKNITEDKTVYAIYTSTLRSYTIPWLDDDGSTLKTESLAYGAMPSYAPKKEGYNFSGWSSEITPVTGDATYTASWTKVLGIQYSWEEIAEMSTAGTAANYMAVGDCKQVYLSGKVGTTAIDTTLYVYILGFNHNSEIEGTGIQFGGFKIGPEASAKDICLVDAMYNNQTSSSTKYFSMNHFLATCRYGWKGCDLRYDVLGSTDVAPDNYTTSAIGEGHDPTSTCATNPVADTLMSCLPENLRAVMKPITKWTSNSYATSNNEADVTASIDYLPLLAEFEVMGVRSTANICEQNYQKQYDYFAVGNSIVKYKNNSHNTASRWHLRSPYHKDNTYFAAVLEDSSVKVIKGNLSGGLAPVFMV